MWVNVMQLLLDQKLKNSDLFLVFSISLTKQQAIIEMMLVYIPAV